MRVLNTAQMREADRRTIDELGVPSIDLMENAGQRVVETMTSLFDDLGSWRVAVLCGRGNNGGDGFVAARLLHEKGTAVRVFLLGASTDVRGDARVNLEALRRLGVTVTEVPDTAAWSDGRQAVFQTDVVVDAVFGTGLSRPLAGMWQAVADDVNATSIPVVSIDLPSGLSADSHVPIGPAIKAMVTVTLGAPKIPLVLFPAASYAGRLVIGDIGIPPEVFEELAGPQLEALTAETVRTLIPERPVETHKGDVGRILVVAGSVGKTGAACLAGRGALRGGAGLVTVATPRSCVAVVAGGAPEYMTLPLPETSDGAVSASALDMLLSARCDVMAIGPGLGTGEDAAELVETLLARADVPIVLDADGLNVCAGGLERLQGRAGRPLVLTPHPGEMARLLGTSPSEVQDDRLAAARRLAADRHAFVVLKGARTLVAAPDGSVVVNVTGNPGMATGGTGDVLTGLIAAWIGQLRDPGAACAVAVYVHGLAGDVAAERHGEVAMTASDLVDAMGAAVQEVTDAESQRDGDGADRA